jgi:hypothetical protein
LDSFAFIVKPPTSFQLYFGTENFQQGEHDPEWKGRLAMIVSLPSNGIFLSALLALSPNGSVAFPSFFLVHF